MTYTREQISRLRAEEPREFDKLFERVVYGQVKPNPPEVHDIDAAEDLLIEALSQKGLLSHE